MMSSTQQHSNPYKVIFIDWDGTLSHSRFWGHWNQLPARHNDYAQIQQRVFQAQPELINNWMRGDYTAEQFTATVAQSTTLMAQFLLDELELSCRRMTFIDSRANDSIQRLRQEGCKVVIATDNMDTFTRWTVPSLGLHDVFDGILNSHAIKAVKKDHANNGSSPFFGPYLASIQVAPADCVLLDDSTNNAVVQDFGINFVHISPTNPVTTVLESLVIPSCT